VIFQCLSAKADFFGGLEQRPAFNGVCGQILPFFFHLEWMTVSGCARGGHRTAGATIGRRRQGLKTQANPRFIENQKNVKDIFLMFFLQLRDKFL